MATLREIANRARFMTNAAVDPLAYLVWAEDGYRQFVHDCGGVYAGTAQIALIAGQRAYPLPSDFRQMKRNGAYLLHGSTRSTVHRLENETADALRAGAAQGRPYGFTFDTAATLVLLPTPNGVDPALTIEFDAEPPASLDPDAALPIPAYVVSGLVGYAVAQAGRFAGDEARRQIGLADYTEAIARYMDAQVMAEYSPVQETY